MAFSKSRRFSIRATVRSVRPISVRFWPEAISAQISGVKMLRVLLYIFFFCLFLFALLIGHTTAHVGKEFNKPKHCDLHAKHVNEIGKRRHRLGAGTGAEANNQISLWFINNTSSSCHRAQANNAHVCQTAGNKDQHKCSTQRILRQAEK